MGRPVISERAILLVLIRDVLRRLEMSRSYVVCGSEGDGRGGHLGVKTFCWDVKAVICGRSVDAGGGIGMRGGRLWHWYATVLLYTWSLAVWIIMLLFLALSSCKYEAFPRLHFGICIRTFV